ncbi:unnamed protein product [Echinostoma caproni]|uniref:Uncharacterized protein n=1 Tax=Echinostoma caproni TaxID=27848 RepID=A0A183ADQ1_9TREM|nr:unnamed protein product [Echinostoma caproni]
MYKWGLLVHGSDSSKLSQDGRLCATPFDSVDLVISENDKPDRISPRSVDKISALRVNNARLVILTARRRTSTAAVDILLVRGEVDDSAVVSFATESAEDPGAIDGVLVPPATSVPTDGGRSTRSPRRGLIDLKISNGRKFANNTGEGGGVSYAGPERK